MECRNCPDLKNCQRQCMKLPDGKTCGDCKNVDWCMMAYGVKPENTSCGFEPIRFKQKEVTEMFECCDCGKSTANSYDVKGLYGSPLFTVHRCDTCEERFKLEMDFQSEGETIEIDTLVCPWCGYEYEDHESCRYYDIGSEEEVDCPSCGRKFDLEVQTTVRFSTKRSLCEMPEDYGKEEPDD